MDIMRALQNPNLLHAAVVHFPIALGVLGFPLLLVAALAKMRPTLRQIVLALYLILAVAAYAGTATGRAISTKADLPAVTQSLETHSLLAGYIWIGAIATAACVLLTVVRSEWLRAMFSMLGILAAGATTALVAATAFYGMTLVYDHGLGTKPKPPVQAAAPNPPAPKTKPEAPAEKPSAPVAVIEPVAPPPPNELESVAPHASADNTSADVPLVETLTNETAEQALTAWKGRVEKNPGLMTVRRGSRKPTQTYSQIAADQYNRAKRWVYQNLWPF